MEAKEARWKRHCFAVLGAGAIAAILGVSGCNDESPGAGGTRCGAATCAIGQACCLDCDGTGQCLVPGGACPGTACLAGGGAGGTAGVTGGGGAGTGGAGGVGGTGTVMCGGTSCAARQICCIDCDGKGMCGAPGSACTGAACIQPRDASADTGAGSRCKAMVVKEIRPGQCDGPNRYYWDGTMCATHDACGCEGADCARLFNSVAECMAAYAGCAGSGQYRCGLGMCNANQVCCGGGDGCSCQPQGVPCVPPMPTCQVADCAEGSCVTSKLDVCEMPTGPQGNGCDSCGDDDYCASYVRSAAPVR